PLLILLIGFGGTLWLAVVINVVCMVALWEYFRIVLNNDRSMPAVSFLLLALVTATAVIWAAYFHSFGALLDIIVLNVVFSGMLSVFKFKSDPSVCEIVFKQVAGIIYVPLFLSYLLFIRNGRDGIIWIFLLLIVVFIGDTGAYYVGSYLGRHKLCPSVSPNKTVEGALGGLLAGLGAGALYKSFLLSGLPWGLSLLFFLSITIAGQMGDLFESQLKRIARIKDSGTLLPGHGGVLDRIDALLFAAPVAYIFKAYLLSG
ncbi:MAG: phosphatidate cytidylyltransferase, partial [Desulfobacterales bacterium]